MYWQGSSLTTFGVLLIKIKKRHFYGVSLFKRGFGGQEVKYLPAHDLVINPLKYLPTLVFETARRHFRRL